MMRQTIMIKSRTCSSTTCPPTLGRSPQTMAERKAPVNEKVLPAFSILKDFPSREAKSHFSKSHIFAGLLRQRPLSNQD